MSRLLSLIALLLCPVLTFAEPTEAPTDGEVIITGDESDDAGESEPAQPEEPAGPMVDSKVYQSWAKHGIGTSIEVTMTFKGEDDAAAPMFTMNAVSSLKEKADDAVTIESTIDGASVGQPVQHETDRQAAKVPAGTEYAPTGFRGKLNEVGRETITVDGKAYECRVMEFDGTDANGTPISGKSWVNDDVPSTHLKGLINLDVGGQKLSIDIAITKINIK